jgi:hypothetical protein
MNRTRKITIAAVSAALAVATSVGVASASSPAPVGPSNYTALAPTRILDTRIALGVTTMTPIASGGVVKLQVVGVDGVPSGVTAVTVNLTATSEAAEGYFTAYPDGGTRATTSSLDYTPRVSLANEVTVPVGSDGAIDIYTSSSSHIVADLEGYYAADVMPSSVTKDLGAIASVVTGGSFLDRASEVGTVDLPAGKYLVSVKAKATPSVSSAVGVLPQFFVYDQVKNASWTGDLLNVGAGALAESNTTIDSYYSGSDVLTLTSATTLHLYAFGYDADRGQSTYALDDLTVSAVPIQ